MYSFPKWNATLLCFQTQILSLQLILWQTQTWTYITLQHPWLIRGLHYCSEKPLQNIWKDPKTFYICIISNANLTQMETHEAVVKQLFMSVCQSRSCKAYRKDRKESVLASPKEHHNGCLREIRIVELEKILGRHIKSMHAFLSTDLQSWARELILFYYYKKFRAYCEKLLTIFLCPIFWDHEYAYLTYKAQSVK